MRGWARGGAEGRGVGREGANGANVLADFGGEEAAEGEEALEALPIVCLHGTTSEQCATLCVCVWCVGRGE